MSEADLLENRLNVFISYSRDDLEFSDQLEKALQVTGFETTLDRHGISGGEDWKSRLGSLILNADTIVFVLSPSSANSGVCKWEVEEAVRDGKRIIPVLCRPLDDAAPPHQLAELNYIFFYPEPKSPGSGFGAGLQRLVEALNTDLDWLREHTRLLERATEWEAGGRPANRLLSGSDIVEAKSWAALRPKNAPEPISLQLDFIKASEAEESRQQNEEAQRLRQMAEAQSEREEALDEKEAAQIREAEARRREAEQSRLVVRRTRIGLLAALALAAVAGMFGVEAKRQSDQAEKALTEQRRVISDAFETGWNALSYERRPDSGACESSLKGVRQIFCNVEQVISLQSLANLSGIPIFRQGPHSSEEHVGVNTASSDSRLFLGQNAVTVYGYNLKSHEIGYYNPEFLDWLMEYAIPAAKNEFFLDASQPLYDARLAKLVHTYRDAYKLVNDPRAAEMLDDILERYQAKLASYTAADEVARHADPENNWFNSPHPWLMEQLMVIVHELTDLSPDYQGYASFDLRTAMGFWIRRKVDGTEPKFYELLESVLGAYEPTALEQQ
jgi:hypothetical protein